MEPEPLPAKVDAGKNALNSLEICRALNDGDLEIRLKSLVGCERKALALLIAHLIEFDRRKLYADLGHSSLYAYCTSALGYSEAEAIWRIYAARTVRRFPVILGLLESGRIHISAVVTLSAHLTEENHIQLLSQAQGKTRREIEFMVAVLAPQPERRDCVCYLPKAADCGLPRPRETIRPFAPRRVRIGFDAGEEFLRKLERVRQLLRHKYPAGKLEDIFDDVVEVFLDKKDPGRKSVKNPESGKPKQTEAPQAEAPPPIPGPEPELETRRIPQAVRDEVLRRDGGQCAFRGPQGARCLERGGLEFDHVIPWALGGPSNDPGNIRILCRTHNQMFARRVFGRIPRLGSP